MTLDLYKGQTAEEKLNYFEINIEKINIPGYELVVRGISKKHNLHAIIAIHNTALGPALGGIRIYPYKDEKDALTDVLRLAKGMTFKAAITQTGLGGGKSIIIADPKCDKTEDMLLAMGAFVDSLHGKYICAEDVGCSLDDVKTVRKTTKYVVGLPHENSSGDPSVFTAVGTFKGIQACLKKIYGSESVENKRIAIQGLGSVGMQLASILFFAGADLIVSDVDEQKVATAVKNFGAETCSVDQIYATKCDIFAPCAMGGIINDKTIGQFSCRAIAGCANNQLWEERHADELKRRKILYAPDYVINAGGLINVTVELTKNGYDVKEARKNTLNIYNSLLSIFEIAEKNNISTSKAANSLVTYRLKYLVGKRMGPLYFHH
jgi:leucine dehydrogenase